MTYLSGLDWMNLFAGLTPHQIVSVVVVAIIFTAAAGLALIALIAFGVRSGLMLQTARIPVGTDAELGAYLGALLFAMISILGPVLVGMTAAENDLDNGLYLPLAAGPILIGGFLLVSGAAIGIRDVRRRHAQAH
jgi:hypothetical protein